MTETRYIRGKELDYLLGLPQGRSNKLARRNEIPHLKLPDGEIRFDLAIVERWLRERASEACEVEDTPRHSAR